MIPILLITGFLGSGKTTFLNWILEKNPDVKISVILNEFGNTQLESQFISKQTGDVIELANGCMCCVAKSDIPRVISVILEHSPQTEFIIIEASGLSDPDPVHEALQSKPINTMAYLESTICIVDAINFEKMRIENAIVTSQIADADIVLISKVSAAGKEQVAKVTGLIQNLAPDITVLQFTEELLPQFFLTGFYSSTKTISHHSHTHEEYQTYVHQNKVALNIDQLINMLESLPDEIIRVKGIVICTNQKKDSFWVRVQKIGSRVTVEGFDPVDKDLKSTVLFIGKVVDSSRLKQKLDSIEQH